MRPSPSVPDSSNHWSDPRAMDRPQCLQAPPIGGTSISVSGNTDIRGSGCSASSASALDRFSMDFRRSWSCTGSYSSLALCRYRTAPRSDSPADSSRPLTGRPAPTSPPDLPAGHGPAVLALQPHPAGPGGAPTRAENPPAPPRRYRKVLLSEWAQTNCASLFHYY